LHGNFFLLDELFLQVAGPFDYTGSIYGIGFQKTRMNWNPNAFALPGSFYLILSRAVL